VIFIFKALFTMVGQAFPLASTMAVLTEEQKRRINPVKTLIDLGVRVGFSADYPVLDCNPFRNMYIAMTRSEPRNPENVATPTLDERVDLATALKCYTVNSAYMVDKEDKIGSIEVGKTGEKLWIGCRLNRI